MFLNAKKIAFLGLLLACTVLLVIFSGVFEFNTLFLLAGASFCVGIAIRESGLQLGFGFLIGATILSLILAPNKFHCITFAAMGFYLFIYEFSWKKIGSAKRIYKRNTVFWIIKYAAFNVMYIPTILLLPHLIFQGKLNTAMVAAILLGGQIALWFYDQAYRYFQRFIWGKIRISHFS